MLKPLIQIALKLLRLKLKKKANYYTGTYGKYALKRDVL
jgi:hypothetical protein